MKKWGKKTGYPFKKILLIYCLEGHKIFDCAKDQRISKLC
jgi:hypothetical protein